MRIINPSKSHKLPLRQMWIFFQPVTRQLQGAAVLSAFTTISTISLLATSAFLICRAAQMPPILELEIAIVGVRAFALTRSVTRYSERLVSHNATLTALPKLRIALYQRLEELTPTGLWKFRQGDLLQRVVADVDDIQDLPLRIYVPVLGGVISGVFATALTAWILPFAGFALGVLLMLAATALPWLSVRSAQESLRTTSRTRGELSDVLHEYVAGLADITMLNNLQQAQNELNDLSAQLQNRERLVAVRSALATGLLTLLQGVAIILCTWAAINATQSGSLDHVLVAVLSLVPLAAFESVAGFSTAAILLTKLQGSAERLCNILEPDELHTNAKPHVDLDETSKPDEHEQPYGTRNSLTPTDLRLESITIGWDSDNPVLTDIDLQIPHGNTVAITGPSGCGKSTLIALLNGFLQPLHGHYWIGDKDSNTLSGHAIREQIVATGHDAHIFATTIAENLRLASAQKTTDEQLWRALKAVNLDDWVRTLPNQLNAVLGDFGTTISGGQRQRLILARMYVANPHIWIIDEPTEYLHPNAAEHVMNNLCQATENNILIVATHREQDLPRFNQQIDLQ